MEFIIIYITGIVFSVILGVSALKDGADVKITVGDLVLLCFLGLFSWVTFAVWTLTILINAIDKTGIWGKELF